MAENQGVYPIDPTTPVGLVRLLDGDTATAVTGNTATYLWYSDAELTALLTVNANDPARTAIYVLRLISMTPSMILKKWTSADLSVDGPAITAALTAAINAIEKGIVLAKADANADFFGTYNLGATVTQPHWLDHDQLLDTTLPLLWSFYLPLSALV